MTCLAFSASVSPSAKCKWLYLSGKSVVLLVKFLLFLHEDAIVMAQALFLLIEAGSIIRTALSNFFSSR